MSIEIKFRGQVLESKQWVYGGVSFNQSKNRFWIHTFDEEGFMKMLEVKPESVGQFTSILDKEDKEIYVGDFISTDLQRPHNKIIFKNGAFMFECFDDNLYHDIFFPTSELQQKKYKYGKIIGNIIDTPELDAVPS